MIVKVVIVLFLVAIIASLASGLFFLVHDSSSKKRTVRALTWRIGLSLAFIVFIAIAFAAGWLHPHGIQP